MAEASPEVTVTLLLAGGHKSNLRLPHNDPLLRSLLASIEDKADGGARVPRPYHLHVDEGEGKRSLIFSGRDLVGITVDPPILFRDNEAAGRQQSPYVLVENFLDPKRHAELVAFALAAESRFTTSSVSTGDEDYRRSRVLFEFPEFAALFREKVGALAPQLMQRFGIPTFPVAEIECQMTAHNDGNYFKQHNDNGSADTLSRTISYVYYFHQEPKAFTGGEFRLYHSRVENGTYHPGDKAADLEPRNNSILFFPSHCHHEVLPVHCASQRFADSRFTVNGWIRRRAA